MDSTDVAIGLSKMDFSAVCHLTLMARSFLQKKQKPKTKQNQKINKSPPPKKPQQPISNSSFVRKHQFYFIQQFCTSLDDKEVIHIDQFYLR